MNRNVNYIEFDGKMYPYREVYHQKACMDVLVGAGSLDRSLFDEDGHYKSEYAQKVDEKFYGFVEDKCIINMSDRDFEWYVNIILD
jgi:hypothetical protein